MNESSTFDAEQSVIDDIVPSVSRIKPKHQFHDQLQKLNLFMHFLKKQGQIKEASKRSKSNSRNGRSPIIRVSTRQIRPEMHTQEIKIFNEHMKQEEQTPMFIKHNMS